MQWIAQFIVRSFHSNELKSLKFETERPNSGGRTCDCRRPSRAPCTFIPASPATTTSSFSSSSRGPGTWTVASCTAILTRWGRWQWPGRPRPSTLLLLPIPSLWVGFWNGGLFDCTILLMLSWWLHGNRWLNSYLDTVEAQLLKGVMALRLLHWDCWMLLMFLTFLKISYL